MGSRIIESHEIGSQITTLIRHSQKRVRLVTPYLNLSAWKHMENAITEAATRKVDVAIMYRRDKRPDYAPLVENFLKVGVRVYDWERLHAKLYIGDEACIVTSMNLDSSSATNSEEFAMYSDEPSVLREVGKYVDGLFANQQRAEQIRPKSFLHKLGSKVMETAVNLLPEEPGYCVRCHKDVLYDRKRPLCDGCFTEWNRYKKLDYPENFCHSCGERNKGTFQRPLCISCLKKETAVRA